MQPENIITILIEDIIQKLELTNQKETFTANLYSDFLEAIGKIMTINIAQNQDSLVLDELLSSQDPKAFFSNLGLIVSTDKNLETDFVNYSLKIYVDFCTKFGVSANLDLIQNLRKKI